MTVRYYSARVREMDALGVPLAGAKLYFFETGSTTPKDTFTTSALTVANSHPVVADAGGLFGNIFLQEDGTAYKAVLVAADSDLSSPIWTADPVLVSSTVFGTVTDIASASTTDIGTISTRNANITGTTTITSFGSSANTGTPLYHISFEGVLTLTHNATSLIIPGATNITTAANDSAWITYLGSGNWRVLSYHRAAGVSVDTASTQTITGLKTFTDVLAVAGTSSNAASITLAEDTDNGVNTVKVIAPAAVTSNRTQTLQDRDGTVMNTDQLRIGASASQSVPTVGAAGVQWTGGDGFLAVTITNTQTGTNLTTKYVAMCDANATPTSIWASGYFYGHSAANWSDGESITLVFPIRNNDYYRIVETETVGATTPIVTEMNFRPLTIT
jgi:hypothetical protein